MKVEIDARHLTELQYAAREYADGRMTYLTQSINEATAALLDAGVKLHTRHGQPSVWASDGNFGPTRDMIERYGIDGKKARTA